MLKRIVAIAVALLLLLQAAALAQGAGAAPSLRLSETQLVMMKGDKAKLEAELLGAEMPKKAKLGWSTSDKAVVSVSKGSLKAVGGGEAVITCELELEDGVKLTEACKVTVKVGVTSVRVPSRKLQLMVGDAHSVETTIKPEDASDPTLRWSTDDPKVAAVNDAGVITAVGSGSCVVSCVTNDGTEKGEKIDVFVPSIKVSASAFSVTEKTGLTIPVVYYGSAPEGMMVKVSGKACTAQYANGVIAVTPLVAGKSTIVLSDPESKASTQKLTITVENSAVYNAKSYPKIKYKDVYRYPDKHMGERVSFSGRVLQVMDEGSDVVLRVSSRGRWDNVVYVTHEKESGFVNILEDDKVTVYGTFDGNYTYTTIMGGSITIPCVKSEKIVIK